MTELAGNQAIEGAAIKFVIAYEASQGREAVDTRGTARGQDLWLEARQVAEAEANPEFWVYVVDNVRQGDPQQFGLHLLGGEQLARLIAKKRVQTTYVSLPSAVLHPVCRR
ncbi:MAG TPA: hypothetical protein VHZ03_08725 [Trebonia sp.]|jgi:hypothetical protein|nr:hypothetical protein [Trebonia sp.]